MSQSLIQKTQITRRITLTLLRAFLAGLILFGVTGSFKSYAQDLEPRTYNNTPTGLNFLLAGYEYSEGALIFDPSLPVTDANAKVKIGFLGYVRTLGIAGKSAKIGTLLPYADLDASGYLSGVYRSRDTVGPADPAFLFTFNFSGAPALSLDEYRKYQQDTVIGFTLKMTAPLGEYDNDKLINIGTNRWSIKPELGISKSVNRWNFEGALAATFFTTNNDFYNGQKREQEPIYSVQGHIVYAFANKVWAAFSTTYYEGGKTIIDGVRQDDKLNNWRTGFTLTVPVNRRNSIKLFGNSGISTRTGTDYDSIGLAWQYRWGGGI